MIYGSVCSGIEAATVAWHQLGWEPAFFSEIEAFPRAVLQHHYPRVPLHGDFTTIRAGDYRAIDLLVGGTPCQSFSIAGLRGGLGDDRGNLALEYLRLADRLRPDWLVWENVPGVLSSNGGRDFGAILGGMVELGYGFAYRVLDAQYFGVPQRRRRVFVVGYLGDWRPAAAVLFERESLSGNPPPRREARERVAGTFSAGSHPGGYNGQDAYNDLLVAHSLRAQAQAQASHRADSETYVTHALRASGFDASEDGTGRGTPLVPVCFNAREDLCVTGDLSGSLGSSHPQAQAVAFALRGREGGAMPETHSQISALRAASGGSSRDYVAFAIQENAHVENLAHGSGGKGFAEEIGYTLEARNKVQAVAFHENQRAELTESKTAGSLKSGGGKPGQGYPAVMERSAVRRLTPEECEKLQGFLPGYTCIPWRGKPADQCPDGPRYKALGNSMAVPVMAWIGRRIAVVASLKSEQVAA